MGIRNFFRVIYIEILKLRIFNLKIIGCLEKPNISENEFNCRELDRKKTIIEIQKEIKKFNQEKTKDKQQKGWENDRKNRRRD